MSDSLRLLTDDTLLLTVNNRLARELTRRHAQIQIDAGRTAWSTPGILPWAAWLGTQYEALLDTGYADRVLLTPHQEMLLWERVVSESSEGGQLLRPTAAARTARQTWRLLLDWRQNHESLADYPSEQTRLFITWARQFEVLCRQAHSLTAAELGAQVAGALSDGVIQPPGRIRLAGFESLTPQQALIQNALDRAGCDIREWRENRRPGSTRRVALPDREQEYLGAANWARARLEQDPRARLAIISPRLEEDRAGLQRCLQQVLDPGAYLPGRQAAPLFNISLGRPLADYPLVAHLLQALRLSLNSPLSLHELGALLRSPFIGGHAGEWLQRAALDARLRNLGRPYLTRRELRYQAQRQAENSAAHCPDLIQRLDTLQELLAKLPSQASPNAWAGHLLALFDALGWPGEQVLDSSEYQQAERLRRVVSEFSTLARVCSDLRLTEAIRRFTQLCEDTEFQPQAGNTPIQALGMLEAAGLDFGGIWLIGMDDQAWPPNPAPNPLIPVTLQREQDMPHASAERELRFARQLLERITCSAAEIILSHPVREDDRELRPSPLINDIPELQLADIGLSPDNPLYPAGHRTDDQQNATEALPDVDTIPLQGAPSGGAGLLADQSACPFKAVAHHRLHSYALPEPSHAPDPRLIGSMMHQLLERIWRQLRDSRTLEQTSRQDLRQLVGSLAEQTLQDLARQRPDLYDETFIGLERERLAQLALAWLDHESERLQPFRVIACEQKVETSLAGLSLRMQIDRIDELDDGSRVIIDYKTGNRVSTRSWIEARPGEPQIPLYCISHENVSAGILAQVNRKIQKMHGLARKDDMAPGVSAYQPTDDIPDWDALLGHWRTRLELLAQEVLDGLARVDPKDRAACEYCDLPALCRIQQGRDTDGDDEA